VGVDLDSVAEELYGLPPSEFTSARNAAVKQARADGNRDLAAEIQQLAKPTTAAWLVNQVARELGDELEPLISLGRDLRDATSNLSGDELRALTRQRHQVVQALVEQARRLGAAHGTKVSDSVATEVQQTLDASLADEGVADAVLGGRLTQSVEYAGFGEPSGVTWAGKSRRPAQRPAKAGQGATRGTATRTAKGTRGTDESGEPGEAAAKVADLAARRREAAERAVAEAAERLESVQGEHEQAAQEYDEAVDAHRDAEHEVERLRADLVEAEQRARDAARTERAARDRVKRADRAMRDAERVRDEADDRLSSLDR
jgi:hypothetical protein